MKSRGAVLKSRGKGEADIDLYNWRLSRGLPPFSHGYISGAAGNDEG